jgi:LysR family transcriptional regulator, glycine cleavage system transcriptional activator
MFRGLAINKTLSWARWRAKDARTGSSASDEGFMTRPPPPLNLIRAFEASARHLSFTKAAGELGYTQAAISGQVRALEQYVGRDLFLRHARSLQLTEVGSAFLPTLRQALAQIDAATDAIASGGRDRTVMVACPVSLAENWLPQAVASFHAAHPDIEVTIHGTVWETGEDPIADLTISVCRHDEVPPGARRLWPETLSLVCAPALADRCRHLADLATLPRVLVSGRQEYWSLLADAGNDPALGQVDLASGAQFRSNSSNVALELAVQGLGITIAVTSLARLYLDRGLLVEPFTLRPESPWAYFVAPGSTRRTSAVSRMMAHLLQCGAANTP